MRHTPRHLDSREKILIAEGKHLRFVRRGAWEYVERQKICGIVGIIAVTDDNKLILVEQYRPPVQKRVVELPAGLAGDQHPGGQEDLAAAAARELFEETGYQARSLTLLTEGVVSAGVSSEVIAVFRASGLVRSGEGGGDQHEDIAVHAVPLAGIPEWLDQKRRDGALIDLKVYAGLNFLSREHPGIAQV